MHRSLRLVLAPVTFAAALAVVSFAAAAEPGYVDFGKLTAAKKGEFVEVNLGRGVLKLASFFAKHHDQAAGDLMAGISRVRVNVVGLDDSNRAVTTERMGAVRAGLSREGWEQIVTVQGRNEEDVAIFLKHRDGEVVEGIVVTVLDARKKEAVFINVVGNIRLEQLGELGGRLNLRQLASVSRPEKG